MEISGHDMKIFQGFSILWSFQDLAGQSWHDQLPPWVGHDLRMSLWPAFLWPSVVKSWLQGELCAQVLYFLRRGLLTAPCWGVLFPSVQRSNAVAFSLVSKHLTFPLTSDGVSWQMVTHFYWVFHWYGQFVSISSGCLWCCGAEFLTKDKGLWKREACVWVQHS